jgi:hypothetical protein
MLQLNNLLKKNLYEFNLQLLKLVQHIKYNVHEDKAAALI